MAEYINREKLMRAIKCLEDPNDDAWVLATFCEVEDLIDVFPTADVVEVKHSKWNLFMGNSDSKIRTCSNCYMSQTVNVFGGEVRFKYCPYCGAKMDGGDLK